MLYLDAKTRTAFSLFHVEISLPRMSGKHTVSTLLLSIRTSYNYALQTPTKVSVENVFALSFFLFSFFDVDNIDHSVRSRVSTTIVA